MIDRRNIKAVERVQEAHHLLQRHIADYRMPKGEQGAQLASSRHITYDVDPVHNTVLLPRGYSQSLEYPHSVHQYLPASHLEISHVPDVSISRNHTITRDFDLRFPTSGPRIYIRGSPTSSSREKALYLPGVTPSEYMRRERGLRSVEFGVHEEPFREVSNGIQTVDYIGGHDGDNRIFSHEKGDPATLCDVEDWLAQVPFPQPECCSPSRICRSESSVDCVAIHALTVYALPTACAEKCPTRRCTRTQQSN